MIVTPLVARPLARLKPEGEPCGQGSRCALHSPFKPYNVEPAWHFTTPPEARVWWHRKATCDVAHQLLILVTRAACALDIQFL